MSCNCVTRAVSVPACKTGCIVAGVHIVYPADSVGRCGEVGIIDMSALSTNNRNVTQCNGNSIVYGLDAWDETGFEYVTRDGTSLNYVFKTTAELGKSYKIRFFARCPSQGLGDYGEILVLVKDVCATLNCNGNQVCDECSETCVDAPVDIEA